MVTWSLVDTNTDILKGSIGWESVDRFLQMALESEQFSMSKLLNYFEGLWLALRMRASQNHAT